jgi:hypothetical protein
MNDMQVGQAIIMRLATENIPALWPQLEPLIVRSLFDTPTTTAEDVFRMLMAYRADAWVQIQPETTTVQALSITDYESTPQGVWLRVWLCAVADGYRLKTQEFRSAIERWKTRQRCRGLSLVGRHGWVKLFPDAKVEGVMMRTTDAYVEDSP